MFSFFFLKKHRNLSLKLSFFHKRRKRRKRKRKFFLVFSFFKKEDGKTFFLLFSFLFLKFLFLFLFSFFFSFINKRRGGVKMEREEKKEISGWVILLTMVLLFSFIGFSQSFSLYRKERGKWEIEERRDLDIYRASSGFLS